MAASGAKAVNITIFKNVFECAKFIGSNYGVRGVYQGLQATILRFDFVYSNFAEIFNAMPGSLDLLK
jgi:hypothetical protein